MEKTLIIIQGPTAVGKTSLSIDLGGLLDTEIINADSRQVFREMNIGTARPEPEELMQIPHHLIGHVSIKEDYNASLFAGEAREILNSSFKERKLMILSGGSGFYVNALIYDMDDIPDIPSEIRSQLNAELNENGLKNLLSELEAADPDYYSKIDKHNPQRVIRALEVIRHTGKPFSSFHNGKRTRPDYRILNFAINRKRENLYERINRRVDKMLEAGLEEEVRSLLDYREFNALQTVGYREFFDYFDEKCSFEECVENIKTSTRRFAKRQLTWLRGQEGLIWINLDEEKKPLDFILKQLNGLA